MDERITETEESRETGDIAALAIPGVFLIVLGATMAVAAFWPPTLAGKLTNLGAAILLLGIGCAMILIGRANRRPHAPQQERNATAETMPPANDERVPGPR